MDLLRSAWNWQIQALPVLLGFLLFTAISLIRRRYRFYYVPIYFTALPFYELNDDLATYFGDDFMVLAGRDLPPNEVDKLRRRILFKALASTPLLVGFLVAFFLSRGTLIQLMVVLAVERGIALSRAFLNFQRHDISTARSRVILGLVYLAYLATVLYVLNAVHSWATPYILRSDWMGLVKAISDLIIGKLLIQGILLALLTAVFTSLVTDREVRKRKITTGDEPPA
jgi:hypothetical protein